MNVWLYYVIYSLHFGTAFFVFFVFLFFFVFFSKTMEEIPVWLF